MNEVYRERLTRRWNEWVDRMGGNIPNMRRAIYRGVREHWEDLDEEDPRDDDDMTRYIRNVHRFVAGKDWPLRMFERFDVDFDINDRTAVYSDMLDVLDRIDPPHPERYSAQYHTKTDLVFPKHEEMSNLLGPYFTKTPKRELMDKALRRRFAKAPGAAPFSRPRPGVDEAPVRPSGMGERSNAAAVAPDYLARPRPGPATVPPAAAGPGAGPAAAGAGPAPPPGSAAAMGGRRKTTRSPSRSSRRRRSTRSRRNRGGAKSL